VADTKRCPKCEKELTFSEFGSDKLRKSGLSVYCKKCNRKRLPKAYGNYIPKGLAIGKTKKHKNVVQYGADIADILEHADFDRDYF